MIQNTLAAVWGEFGPEPEGPLVGFPVRNRVASGSRVPPSQRPRRSSRSASVGERLDDADVPLLRRHYRPVPPSWNAAEGVHARTAAGSSSSERAGCPHERPELGRGDRPARCGGAVPSKGGQGRREALPPPCWSRPSALADRRFSSVHRLAVVAVGERLDDADVEGSSVDHQANRIPERGRRRPRPHCDVATPRWTRSTMTAQAACTSIRNSGSWNWSEHRYPLRVHRNQPVGECAGSEDRHRRARVERSPIIPRLSNPRGLPADTTTLAAAAGRRGPQRAQLPAGGGASLSCSSSRRASSSVMSADQPYAVATATSSAACASASHCGRAL